MQLDAFRNDFFRCIDAIRCVKKHTQLGAYAKCMELSQCGNVLLRVVSFNVMGCEILVMSPALFKAGVSTMIN